MTLWMSSSAHSCENSFAANVLAFCGVLDPGFLHLGIGSMEFGAT
jgi:hypothetical protein